MEKLPLRRYMQNYISLHGRHKQGIKWELGREVTNGA